MLVDRNTGNQNEKQEKASFVKLLLIFNNELDGIRLLDSEGHS